jgi:hypothetical protein
MWYEHKDTSCVSIIFLSRQPVENKEVAGERETDKRGILQRYKQGVESG